MNLLEGAHFKRRSDQPSRIASKEFVDCLFCRVPSDSDDEPIARATFTKMQAKHNIRLDKLKAHYIYIYFTGEMFLLLSLKWDMLV